MKTETNVFSICMLCLCMCATFNTKAQQPRNAGVTNKSEVITTQKDFNSNYTYRVFQAPNKMYGYDLFDNGRGIFHQPAAIVSPGNSALTQKTNSQETSFIEKQTPKNIELSKKEYAEHAALLSIEKIKKQMPPALTKEEINRLITQ